MAETRKGWVSALTRMALGAIMSLAMATAAPAGDDFRSCEAGWVIQPTDGGTAVGSAVFTARAGVAVMPPMTNIFGIQFNQAREAARRLIEECVRAHWAAPYAASPPPVCLRNDGPGKAGIHGYPFRNLMEDITGLVCPANPGQSRLVVDIFVSVRGDTGCIPPPNRWKIVIRNGWPVNCPLTPEARTIAPPPQLERVTPAPRTIVPRPELSRPQTYADLPNMRLPGNDLYRTDAATWQQCRDACTAEDRCRAFTFRERGSACLLKHAAGPRIADSCCHSGLKN